MKKEVIKISFLLVTVAFAVSSCGTKKSADQQDEQEQVTEEQDMMQQEEPAEGVEESADTTDQTSAMYHCPMKCKDDKQYTEAGQCPECGMEMEVVAANEDGAEGQSDNTEEEGAAS